MPGIREEVGVSRREERFSAAAIASVALKCLHF